MGRSREGFFKVRCELEFADRAVETFEELVVSDNVGFLTELGADQGVVEERLNGGGTGAVGSRCMRMLNAISMAECGRIGGGSEAIVVMMSEPLTGVIGSTGGQNSMLHWRE